MGQSPIVFTNNQTTQSSCFTHHHPQTTNYLKPRKSSTSFIMLNSTNLKIPDNETEQKGQGEEGEQQGQEEEGQQELVLAIITDFRPGGRPFPRSRRRGWRAVFFYSSYPSCAGGGCGDHERGSSQEEGGLFAACRSAPSIAPAARYSADCPL